MTVHTMIGFDGVSLEERRDELKARTWFDGALDCISARNDAYQFVAAFPGRPEIQGTWSSLPTAGGAGPSPHNGGGTYTILGFDLIGDVAVITTVEAPHWLAAAHHVIDALEHPTSTPNGTAAASFQFVAALAGDHQPLGTWQDLVASLSKPQPSVDRPAAVVAR